MAIKISGTTVIDDNRKLVNYRLTNLEIGTSTTAVTGNNYIATANVTLTLPTSPTVGDVVGFQNSANSVSCVIARNGSNIMSLSEDMIIDRLNHAFILQYAGSTRGWVFA